MKVLLSVYRLGVVELRTQEPPLASGIGHRPVCSLVACLQAAEQGIVTNFRHASVGFEGETMRRLLPLMDGTLDRNELARKLRQINPDVEPIERILEKLFRLALLLRPAE